jgi:hypothetical protein
MATGVSRWRHSNPLPAAEPGRDMTSRYPELAVLGRRARVPVILDGEIIAIRQGRPD